jgi:4-hydroxy-4-methyl-2-oxoglutarate aldolase
MLKIPPEIAAELLAAADRVIESEQALLRWVRSRDFDPDRLGEMRARH